MKGRLAVKYGVARSAKGGGRIPNGDAPDVLAAFSEIEKSDGVLTPAGVLKRAKNSRSPLHKYFDWDDSSAAYKYRIQQARSLIQTFTVEIVGPNPSAPVRAFVSVSDASGAHSFRRTVDVMSDAQTREQILERALAELEAWQRRYQHLTELAAVFEAAGKAMAVMRPRKASTKGARRAAA